MTTTPSRHNKDGGWVEALHAMVVGDTDAELRTSAKLPGDEKDAVLDCLRQLEQVRRSGVWRHSWPSIALASSCDGRRLGRFEIIRELGRGGHGVVLLALDPNLRREVALKVPRPEVLAVAELRKRFLREAHAAARLSHPGIVTVYEIGDVWPGCYLATDYCSGGSLQTHLASRAEGLASRTAASVVAELASAVQYAHEHGVLHRDIKPSNVLLAPRDDVEQALPSDPLLRLKPKLADFGLARLADNDAEQTATGTLLGTLAYMAPEQAEGRLHDVGPKTDVYAMGALLYEMLTGQPPARGSSDADTLRQILFVEPMRPRTLRRDIAKDLEAICLRALEKDPRQRYSSAGLLAEDLQRYLKGLPVLAKPPTALQRAAKWARRRPALAALMGVCAVTVVAGILGLSAYNVQLRQLTDQAIASERNAQQLLYAADMAIVQQVIDNGGVHQANELLERHRFDNQQGKQRDFAWYFLDNLLHRDQGSLPRHPGDVYGLAFSPDGRRLATTCRDGHVRVWRLPDKKLLHELQSHRGEAGAVAFSPDGGLLASGGDDGRVVVYESANYRVLHVLENPAGQTKTEVTVAGIQFTPDGGRLFAGMGHDICVWNVTTGNLIGRRPEAHGLDIRAISLSSDATKLLTVRGDACFWNADSLEPITTIQPGAASSWRGGRFFRDGRHAVLTNVDGSLVVCDLADDKLTSPGSSNHTSAASEVAITTDSRIMISVGDDGLIQVYDAPLDEQNLGRLRVYRRHQGRVWDVKLAPDESFFVSAGADGEVVFWETPRNTRSFEADGSVEIWSAPSSPLQALAYSPDGRFVACGGNTPLTNIVDRRTGRVLRLPSKIGFGPNLCFTANSRQLISVEYRTALRVWDVRNGQLLSSLDMPEEVYGTEQSPRNDRLALVFGANKVRLYSSPELQPLHEFADKRDCNFARFDPSGDSLIFGRDGELAAFDPYTFRQKWSVGKSGDSFYDVDWVSDHEIVVAEGRDGVALRKAEDGELIKRLAGHPEAVRTVAASPHLRNFASASDSSMLLWDRRTLQPLLKFEDRLLPNRRGLQFSPQGDELVMAQNRPGGPLSTLLAAPRGKGHTRVPWIWPMDMRAWTVKRTDNRLTSAFAWRPGVEAVLLGDASGKLRNWSDGADWTPCETMTTPFRHLLMAQDGQRVLTIQSGGQAHWRSPDGLVGKPFQLPLGKYDFVELHQQELLLGFASESALIVVDATSGEETWRSEHPDPITGMKQLPTGQLITTCEDGGVRSFDFQSGVLTRHEQAVAGIAITWLDCSTDGSQLVVLATDGSIRVLESSKLREIRRFPQPPNVRSVYFFGCDRWLLFGEGRQPLLEIATGKHLLPLPVGPDANVRTVSPGGDAAIASDDASLYLIELNGSTLD